VASHDRSPADLGKWPNFRAITAGMTTTLDPRLSLIVGRRSIRAYRPAPVSEEIVTNLLAAAMAAPSACAKDPWRFVVMRQRDTLAAIAEALKILRG
jgi:nitroreductase